MTNHFLRNAFIAFSLIVSAVNSAVAEDTGDTNATDKETLRIQEIVREYILNNPEIIVEAFSRYEELEEVRVQAESQAALEKYRDELYFSKTDYVAGNPDGDLTIVEFFDYNCGWCRRATPILLDLLEQDENLRVVFKEFPIRGSDSDDVAKASLASIRQGKYFDLHATAMQVEGTMDLERFQKMAKDLGVDLDRLNADMEDPDIEKTIGRNLALANMLYIEGTPTFLVGDIIVRGWPGADGMRDLIAQARNPEAAEAADDPS